MVYMDGDERYSISSTELTFFHADKKDGGSRCCVHCLLDTYDEDDSDTEGDFCLMDIDNDLLGLLWTHHKYR